jgi:hypothetical protein
MFAAPKLIVISLFIVAAWVGYRWLNGLTCELSGRRPPARRAINAEDLVACRVCGAYIAAGAPVCGRSDCPQPG